LWRHDRGGPVAGGLQHPRRDASEWAARASRGAARGAARDQTQAWSKSAWLE